MKAPFTDMAKNVLCIPASSVSR